MSSPAQPSAHQYEGTLLVCLKCYRPKSDPVHQNGIQPLESRVSPPALNSSTTKAIHSHTCESCGKTEAHNDVDCLLPPTVLCESCRLMPAVQFDRMLEIEAVSHKPAPITCSGHICPVCHTSWTHDYSCKTDKKTGLCPACASQTAADISRPNEIEQIAMTEGQILSGSERAGIMIEHDSVVYNLCHGSDGNLVSDWQEKIHEHRRNLKQMIEKLRCKEMSSSRMLAKIQTEEATKLTPEEREQFLRDARRGRQTKASARPKDESKPKVVDQAKLFQDLCKQLGNQIRVKRPDLSSDEVIRRAEERARKMQEEDE
jgi:hypothetical protein